MSDFDNIGKLMHLPMIDIELTTEIKEPHSLISAASESILKSNGRNWIPVIVIEVADYQYQVVSNQFIYAAVREAKLERVWCIVIDHAPETLDQVSILNKEPNPVSRREPIPRSSRPKAIPKEGATLEQIIERLKYLQDNKIEGFEKFKIDDLAVPLYYLDGKNWSKTQKEMSTYHTARINKEQVEILKELFYE